jgi:hypothetical protein
VLPFVCDHCGRAFSRKDILQRHIRRQHSTKNGKTPRFADKHISPVTDPTLQADTLSHDEISSQLESLSPSHSDNTHESPEAVLGNTNQAVSHLQNEDFMAWLLTGDPSPFPSQAQSELAVPFLEPAHVERASLESSFDIKIPEYLYFNTAGATPDDQEPTKSVCSMATCSKIRRAINIPEDNPLVQKFINPSFISYAVDIYWSLHNRWPILHRPTFSLNEAPPHLVISMITIAMYLTQDEDAIQLSIRIHETLRYNIYMLPEFKAPTAIFVFQSLLLAEIFEMMISTEEQHDMATRFYPVLVASMRKGGTMGLSDDSDDRERDGSAPISENEVEWRRFINHEGKRRIAFFAFVLDTQHSTFFNQPPSVFISDLPFRLPCEEALWEAGDAPTWALLKQSFPPNPYFKPTVSSFLKLENTSYQLSPWNMMIVLHGLMSVAWNLRLRESIMRESGVPESPAGEGARIHNGGNIISESYGGWLRCYRVTFIISGKLPFNHPYVLGCLTTYEFAHVILNADIQRCQQFIELLAGMSQSRSKKNAKSQNESTFNALHQWANSGNAILALNHALDLIDMFSIMEQKYDVSKETAFHRPWCLYAAVMTVWVFQYFSGLAEDRQTASTVSLSQYLGRARATISRRFLETSTVEHSSSIHYRLMYNRHYVDTCEANVLLLQVTELLSPCRWGFMKGRLRIVQEMLGIH